MTSSLPIIICGAGISGLALGQGLKKANVPFRIFERDPALNMRSQGYRVGINYVGIAALREILPDKLFEQLNACSAIPAITPDEAGRRIDALKGEKLESFTLPNHERLNCDRTVLRRVLIQGLEDCVSFGKEFSKFDVLSDNTVKVHFNDGTEIVGCMLVGADGTRSRVRKQLLPSIKLIDTEGRFIYGKTPLTKEVEQKLNKHADFFCIIQQPIKGRVLTCLMEPVRFKENEFRKELPEDYIYWVLGGCKDIFDMGDDELMKLGPEECAAESIRMTKQWDESFHVIFDAQTTNKTSILALESSKEDIEAWETQDCVTFLGDSIHTMSPTAGVGTVTAVRSAAALTRAIREDGVTRESLTKYEKEMRAFASEAIQRSLSTLR